MIRRFVLAVVLAASCAPAFAQEGKTRRTEGVVFLRTSAPTAADDLRLGDWWIDYDSATIVAYILTDDSPVTWTAIASGAGIGHKIQDEGVTLAGRDTIDFAGAGVTCADSGGTKTLCTIPGGAGSGYDTIEDEGTPLTQRTTLNIIGTSTACVDSGAKTECTFTTQHALLEPPIGGGQHTDTASATPDLGYLIYGNGSAWDALNGNITTTKKFLSQTGTGAVSAAPAWVAIGSVCTTPQFSRGVLDTTAASCAQPSFSEISGAVSDAQVPDNITITLAAAATALAANGANCAVGQAARGVDANGAAEDCFAPTAAAHNLLSASHGDTDVASPAQGDLIAGTAGGLWSPLAVGTDGDVLTVQSGLPAWVTPTVPAPSTAEYIVSEADATLSAEVAPSAANQVPVSSSSTAAAWGTVPIAAGGTGQTTRANAFDALAPSSLAGEMIYSNGTDNVALPIGTAYSILRTNSGATAPEWGHRVVPLTGNVGVAVNATYVTVFSTTPVASKTNVIHYNILHTASATTVGVQFRVSSADAGNVGNCFFTAHGIAATAASAVAEEYDVIAIGAAPADNGAAAAGFTALNLVEIWCQFTSDGTPGAVLLEAQLETGTTSINVLAGSYYTYIFN